tara:strand:- start:2434 stop:3675 length:1242 start_codon:yes stop_codon:yes gene_type:complete
VFSTPNSNIPNKRIGLVLDGITGLATIVGLSTEGYSVASTLIQNGIETIIVDENLQMGMKLTPDIISSYGEVSNLLEEETLVSLESMQSSINRADYILFTPKIRKTDQEAKAEVNTRFRDIAKNISKNTIIIFCLPVGFNENKVNIAVIEKMSGLKEGEDFEYIYAPLQPRSKNVLSLGPQKIGEKAKEIFKKAGINLPKASTLEISETLYFRNILSQCIPKVLNLEVYKKIPNRDERLKIKNILGTNESEYLDKITESLFDLKFVVGTLDTGDPSLYLTTGILKSIDGYVKYVVDEIRNVMKQNELKASKTKITLAWSVDKYEMRGERLAVLNSIKERLHDYIGDVNILNRGEYTTQAGRGFTMTIQDMNKTDIVVICSEEDQKYASKVFNLDDKKSETVVLMADLLVNNYK